MKKKYVIETEEIISCDNCSVKNRNKSNCNLYNEFNGCPFVELKPKQLEWEEYNKMSHIYVLGANPNETCVIYVSNTPIGKAIIHELINGRGIKIEFEAITRFIFSEKELIEAKQSINNAKKFCQKYYNKLFYEMIGE